MYGWGFSRRGSNDRNLGKCVLGGGAAARNHAMGAPTLQNRACSVLAAGPSGCFGAPRSCFWLLLGTVFGCWGLFLSCRPRFAAGSGALGPPLHQFRGLRAESGNRDLGKRRAPGARGPETGAMAALTRHDRRNRYWNRGGEGYRRGCRGCGGGHGKGRCSGGHHGDCHRSSGWRCRWGSRAGGGCGEGHRRNFRGNSGSRRWGCRRGCCEDGIGVAAGLVPLVCGGWRLPSCCLTPACPVAMGV